MSKKKKRVLVPRKIYIQKVYIKLKKLPIGGICVSNSRSPKPRQKHLTKRGLDDLRQFTRKSASPKTTLQLQSINQLFFLSTHLSRRNLYASSKLKSQSNHLICTIPRSNVS